MRPRLTPQGLTTRLILLVGVMAVGMLISTLVSVGILAMTGFTLNATSIRWIQLFQALTVFLIPALLMAGFAAPESLQSLPSKAGSPFRRLITPAIRFLYADTRPSVRQFVLTVISMLLLIVPMNAIIEWNEAMNLPASLSGLETWMAERESAANALIDTMLANATPPGIVANILIMGVVAALSEELFFRGLFQHLLLDRWHNKGLAILLTAITFSAIHLQFYGFVPRLLLGAYFGWLLITTQSVWPPVVAHLTNNLLALLQYYLEQSATFAPRLEAVDTLLHTPSIAYSAYVVTLVAFGWTVLRIRR